MPKPKSSSADPAARPHLRPLRRRDREEWLRLRRALWPDCSTAMHRLEMRLQSVRTRNRGAGWGGRFIAAATVWTAARGLTEMASDAGLVNHAGIGAHRATGFRETFRLVHFLKKTGCTQR